MKESKRVHHMREVLMRNLTIFSIICIMPALAGCDREATSPATSGSANLTAQAVPEQVQKLLDQYALSEDAGAASAELAQAEITSPPWTDTSYDVYAVTLLWGSFLTASTSPNLTTDWSGRLMVNYPAVLAVKCIIDFDHGQDSLLPAVSPMQLPWVSYVSGVDFDGLSLLVFLKRNSVLTVIPELFFETAPISLQWDFVKLAKLDAFYPTQNGSGLAVHARKLKPYGCPKGLLEGKWIKESNTQGRFEGMWMDHNSAPSGVVAGTWWTNSDGLGQFSGWVSGLLTDQIIAYLEGTWCYDDPRMCPLCGQGHGRFKGKVRWANDGAVGSLEGEFGDWSLPPDDKVMPFKGKWQMHCVNLTTDDVRMPN